MSGRLSFATLLALALHVASVRASDTDESIFSFSGFGTVGLVHSSEKQADFTSSTLKPYGAGYSHAWSADVDSLIAGQVSAKFTPQLSAVLQVIARQNSDNTYRPHVEWAFIKYQFTPNFSVRAGRTLLPTFLFSDSRQVAYAYPWVRPTLEVYRQEPITSSDGVDVTYQIRTGDITNVLQARFGKNENKTPAGLGSIKSKRMWGLSYTGEYHAATLHIGYESSHITLDGLKPIFYGFRQFGSEGIALADKYEVNNKAVSLVTIGARYDPGKWFVMGEWAHLATHSIFGKGTGWYVSGGYRIGKFAPYLTYARATVDNLSDPGLNLSTVPPSLVGTAAGLNAVLNSLLSAKPVQNTLSIGARWDFARNVALKVQYDHSRIGAGSSGVLTNLQPGFRTGGEFNLISASIDFVF